MRVHVGLPELACSCGHGRSCVAIPDRNWAEAQEWAWQHEQRHVVLCRHVTAGALPMWKRDGVCARAEGHKRISLGHQAMAERVIRETVQSGRQNVGSGSKVMGPKSQIGHVLIRTVALGKLLNLSLPHFPISKTDNNSSYFRVGWKGLLS